MPFKRSVPGIRANRFLLHRFSRNATEKAADQRLNFSKLVTSIVHSRWVAVGYREAARWTPAPLKDVYLLYFNIGERKAGRRKYLTVFSSNNDWLSLADGLFLFLRGYRSILIERIAKKQNCVLLEGNWNDFSNFIYRYVLGFYKILFFI